MKCYQVGGRRSYLKIFCLETVSHCSQFHCFATSLVYIDLGSAQVQLPSILEHNISMYLGYGIIACQDLPKAQISHISVGVFVSRKERGKI